MHASGRADKDGEDVCMCIRGTARGADRLLNLQLVTGEWWGGGSKKEREGGRELGVGV